MPNSHVLDHAEHAAPPAGMQRAKAQPKKYSPSITDIPYRTISIYLSVPLAKLKASPNQITTLWILMGVIADVFLGSSRYWVEVAAAALFQISYLLDFVDGEVARLEESSSKRGLFLDLVGHEVVKSGIFLGIAYRMFQLSSGAEYLVLAFLGCIGLASLGPLNTFGVAAGLSRWKRAESNVPQGLRIWPRFQGLFGILFESPGVYGLVLVATILQKTEWILLFYGICGPLWLLLQLVQYRYD